MNLKITRVSPTAKLPTRATSGSAGYDLYADLSSPFLLRAGERALIPTGVAIALQSREIGAFVYARSGLSSKHGITMANGVGVVDSDYRGELKVPVVNLSQTDYSIEPGERIAQLVLHPVIPYELEEVSTLDETQRGSGGFGSSGRK
ncbi:MAG TPA: dUTP diphosphatase [Firmicutes bacterium]|nr:dUTP diphosphatase [Bacillota bacterium]